MITLYGAYRSRASRPLWLLGELGLEFKHVPVLQAYRLADPQAKGVPLNTASPEFLKINPMGQIPCLTDGALVLTESLAMTLYLARQYGGVLGPQTAQEDGEMLNWTLFAATNIEDPALIILQALTGPKAEEPAERARADEAAKRLSRPLARLEAHLGSAAHLVGNRFTAADIIVAECLRYAQSHTGLFQQYPKTDAWIKAAQSRPAFKAFWEKRLAEPA